MEIEILIGFVSYFSLKKGALDIIGDSKEKHIGKYIYS